MSQKITPFLWFDDDAEEAIKLYISVFKNGKILSENYYPKGSPPPAVPGSLMVATFELFGQEYSVINGGPIFKHTEAFSLSVDCENQEEVDEYWNALTANGGSESQCGWLKDKFGISWQIIPKQLPQLMSDPNPAKAQAVMQAMLKMQKIDVAKLQEAYDGVE